MTLAIKIIIAIGIIVRVLLMPITFHPDIKGHYLGAWLITQKNQLLGMYDYISKLPRNDPMVVIYNDNFFVYSPVTYWLHSIWMIVSSPLIPWEIYEKFELDTDLAKQSPLFPQLMFVLKIPYLAADVILLLILLKITPPDKKKLMSILWVVNFPLIHSAYLMGQFDVFMVLGIALAYLVSIRKHHTLASVIMAVAAGFKPFPLILIPFLPGKVVVNIIAGLATYALIILPYALLSPGYRMYALVAEHSDKMWYAKILVSGSQYLPIFMVGLAILVWLRYFNFNRLSPHAWLMSPLLLFYSVTHFHPQWFAWITPLLFITIINHSKVRLMIAAIVVCYLAVLFSFDNSLHFGLFGLKGIEFSSILNDKNMSLIRGLLAGTSIVLLINLIKPIEKNLK